jgi:serine/threonine-protein kinase
MHAERLGKYQLVKHLASGGMASVYLARISGPGGFERHVVLKTLRTEGLVDPTLIPMFLDEARLVAMLHHQHISQVYEVGNVDGTYFLAMEYVHGETVRDVLERAVDRGRVVPLEFGITVVCAAAAGLHHAHEQRGSGGAPLHIVHRDVTPSNVIVSYDGSIKLIDFGIAKADGRATHTRTGFIKGKVGYMAPEQVLGYAVDRRSDVFALGVLAYELTTQQRAFAAGSQFETLERTVHSDLVPPSKIIPGYPAELEHVILTALEIDPDDRYANANAMRRALEEVAAVLELRLGESAVVVVLDELFGVRAEPWLEALSSTGDEEITPIREVTPIVALPALSGSHAFARGSGEHDPIDDSAPTDPQPLDSEDVVTDRLALVDPPVPPAPVVAASVAVVAPVTVARPPWLAPSPVLSLPRVSAPPPPKSRRGPRIAMVGVALAFVVGVVAITAFSGDDVPTAAPVATPPVAVPRAPTPVAPRAPVPPVAPGPALAPPSPPVTPPPSAGDRVTLQVITDPPGATVVLDGVRLGTAPYTLELPARQGLAWLKVRKSDRLPVKIRVSLDHDVTWNVRLPARHR